MEVYILNTLGIRPWEIQRLTPQDKNDLLGMRALEIERDDYESDKSKGKGNITHLKGKNSKTI
jgi:hypothetical protein